uniref:Uncharacterized protein n=1 Tax=Salix viminalis TaxID=40686 RepID=A0A6N2JXR4_SALVM
MFQIVRARAENDAAKDATLTQTLRELMTKQNMGKTRVDHDEQTFYKISRGEDFSRNSPKTSGIVSKCMPFFVNDFVLVLDYLKQERKNNDKKLSWSVKRIGADMVEISEGQKRIREGQKETRKRIQEIIEEGAKLKEETKAISKQSSENQLRLDLMFQIVKARAEKDYAKDALLTQTLRRTKVSRGGGASQDQRVKKRKNREDKKWAKKMKMIEHSLRAVGEENEKIEQENGFKRQMLRRNQAEIKQQKAGFCDVQNKKITEQESRVGALLKEPLVQDLLARSNQLELAQGAMLSPNASSDARVPSEDAIIELKHRSEMLSKTRQKGRGQ